MAKPTDPPAVILCLSCNKLGINRCSGCSNARYCSAECQRNDWKQHKSVCAAFSTLTERPSPNHIRAILFPVDEDKPRFVWITRYKGWFHPREAEFGPLLGNPDGHETGFFDMHHGLRRPLVGNKGILLEYNSTFALDGSPSCLSLKDLKGVKHARKWCGSFIAHGYYDDYDKLVDTVDVDTNDLGALVEYFNVRVDTIPECCLPGSWYTCADGLRDGCKKKDT